VDGETLETVVSWIRGEAGTQVTLRLVREGAGPMVIAITRANVQREAVTSQILAEGQVGYLRIDGFTTSAAGDFKRLLGELVADRGLKRIVLDLRDDPGGFVDSATTIASQFIGSGPIYWEQTTRGERQIDAEEGGVATDPSIQLAVLVNSNTASASEIVAGALKDAGRGRLVGETTFGKGTVQQWHLLPGENGGFRLSVAKWLTPNKTWIHGVGIAPDVTARHPEGTPADEDPVLTVAVKMLTLEEDDPAVPSSSVRHFDGLLAGVPVAA
jgi:carboxyl-terminal processing protease